jgi:hypothetical protein
LIAEIGLSIVGHVGLMADSFLAGFFWSYVYFVSKEVVLGVQL